MIVTIQEVTSEFTKKGAEYKKVKGIDATGKETTKSVFDNLKDKWHLLVPNATLTFEMEKEGQFWNVKDIIPVKEIMKQVAVEKVRRETLDSKQTSIEGQTSFKALTRIFMTWFKVPLPFKEMEKAMPDDNWKHLFDMWTIGLSKIDPWLYGGEEHAKTVIPDKTIVKSETTAKEIKPTIAAVPEYQGWLTELWPQVKHLITLKTFTSLALPLPNPKAGILGYTKSLTDGERVLFFDAIKSKLEQASEIEPENIPF